VSKAFTSEESPDLPSLAREPPVLAPGEVRYVTPEGHAALRAELERLRSQVADAPEGDAAARAALEQRVALVFGTLAALTVLGPEGAPGAPDGTVAFARWIVVRDEDGHETTWRIVGPDEADPRHGLVSVHSPVGRALLGREEGDEVEVQRPGGPRTSEVIAVRSTRP
jgi:transcription elongation factor GreB